MAFKLRDYQEDLISRARKSVVKNRRIILQAATGAGKTVIASEIIKTAMERGNVFFLVHQDELLKQTSESFWRAKIPHGLCVSGRVKSPHPVQLASIMTLKNRLKDYKKPSVIIIDEAHRSVAKTYQDIVNHWSDAFVIGLTATPQRTDGRGLGEVFSDIIKGPSIRYLIATGALCDYELYGVPQQIQLGGVRTTAGDFNKGDLEKEAMKPQVTGDAVEHYKKMAYGKPCVVMCATIKHAEAVAKEYRESGIPAEAIHGFSSDRKGALKRFESGELMVLCSVQLLIEGVDIPQVGCVQWLRPTKSLVIWMQGNGRGLRPHPSKDKLIILDHVGNYARHGLPCMDRDWSLEGDKRQGRKQADPDALGVQTCKECFFTFQSGGHECPHCGHAVEFKERKIEVVDGELQKIEAAAAVERERKERRQEQGRARDLEELVQAGKNRGMKRPDAWAANVYAARQKRKANAADYARARAAL